MGGSEKNRPGEEAKTRRRLSIPKRRQIPAHTPDTHRTPAMRSRFKP
jgi:hypothetical protein